jgi:carboxymethylenebutenolidase
MTDVSISTTRGEMPVHVATPAGDGPWPGVVVIHDAAGLDGDTRSQARWLADAGFLAVAPDLFYWGRPGTCLRSFIRDALTRRGPSFDDIEAARTWLAEDERCTGDIGVIGFCISGGFALLLAPSGGYQVSSVNYGGCPKDAETLLRGACPIVASYGAKDPTPRAHGAAQRLGRALTKLGVEHDVKQYPEAGHAFLNDRRDPVSRMMKLAHIGYHEASAGDARRRIVAFFDRHLRASESS